MLQTQCSYGDTDGLEFALDGRMYELDYQIVDGDVDLPEYAFQGTDMTSQGTVQNTVNPFAPGDFAEKRVLKLVEWFSGHCRAIKS